MKKLTPPKNGAELRKRILAEHEVDSAAALVLLDQAGKALDQANDAERLLAREGLTVAGSRGPRPHPAVAISRDARTRLLAAIKALKLEL